MADTFNDFQKEGNKDNNQSNANDANNQSNQQQGNQGQQEKEPVVIINGKERPLKNYEEEMNRKHEAEIQRVKEEYEARMQSSNQPGAAAYGANQQGVPDWITQLNNLAENEIATTGKTVPMQTILTAANQLSSRNVEQALTLRDNSEKIKRSFIRKNRIDPVWKDIEEDFMDIADQLRPDQVNEKTLDVILLAAKGKSAEKKIKDISDKAKENADKDMSLIGNPSSGSVTSNPRKETLTAAQRKELDMMNMDNNLGWTEEEYLSDLKRKQDNFKRMGAMNVPQLLSDSLIKAT